MLKLPNRPQPKRRDQRFSFVTFLGVLLFAVGLILAFQGWSTIVRVQRMALSLKVDTATVRDIRSDVETLGEEYKKP